MLPARSLGSSVERKPPVKIRNWAPNDSLPLAESDAANHSRLKSRRRRVTHLYWVVVSDCFQFSSEEYQELVAGREDCDVNEVDSYFCRLSGEPLN